MTKKRTVISYDNLSTDQKKGLKKEYPDGYASSLNEIKTPKGEIFNTLIWETDETIYLVKFTKTKAISLDDDDDDDYDDDLDDDSKEFSDDDDED